MKPYYEQDGIVIYHGDCREVLPSFAAGSFDAVVTDPPYESMKGGTIINHAGVAARTVPYKTLAGELGNADGLAECARVASKGAIAFCSFHWIDACISRLGGERRCLISWFKRNSAPSVNNAPHFLTEYAWAVQYAPGIEWRRLRTHYDIPMLSAGCMATERITRDGRALHPTQKPVDLMRALLLPGMETILDPYMGTGTTLRAAKDLGRRAIGIEIEERYCEIAVNRLSQGVLPFASKPEKEKADALSLFE